MVSMDPQIWIMAIMTLFVLSFLYKETYLYRFAEHTVVAISAATVFSLGVKSIRDMCWTPLMKGEYGFIVPFILGLLLYASVLSRKYNWLNRWSLATMVGISLGINIKGAAEASILTYILSTIELGKEMLQIGNVIFLIAMITSILLFTFTKERKGLLLHSIKIGRFFMMVWCGSVFGSTVVTRLSPAIARWQFLLWDWLGLV